MEPTLVLRRGRERSVQRHHPWIFSGAIEDVTGQPEPGATVVVATSGGEVLGRAAFSPQSQLRARMWTFDPDTPVDEALIAERIAAANGRRGDLAGITDACRVVLSEADGVPGLIADRYGDTVVAQFATAGAERWREPIADALAALPGVARVYERSDVDGREREGLLPRTGPLRGGTSVEGDGDLVVAERDVRYHVSYTEGQKTGFYLDQRDSRAAVARLAAGRRVLNVFSYTGAFGIVAAVNGAASVTHVDSSSHALAGVGRNAALNAVEAGELIEGDAFAELRRLRDRARSYDLIVLDPPKLAPTEAHVERASRAYKDLNLTAAKLLAPGGMLLTFSCSGGMSAELFQKVVAGAALDARRELRIVGRLEQASDHPVPLSFPEARYLKGLVLLAE